MFFMNDTDVNAIVVVSCDEQVAREVRRGRARDTKCHVDCKFDSAEWRGYAEKLDWFFDAVEMKKVRRTGGI